MEQEILNNNNLIYYVLNMYNLSIDEFYDLGMIGLVKGVKTYDENYKTTKSTYYIACIKNELRSYIRKHRIKCISLNQCYNEEGESELIDTIPDERLNPNELLENKDLIKILYKCVEQLPYKYQKIIINQYGLYNTKRKTQKETALELKNNEKRQSEISRNLTIALSKLKKLMEEKNVTKSDRFN